METIIEVIVPTFINAHLFWIVPKRNILLRAAINEVMQKSPPEKISNKPTINMLISVKIDGTWMRGVIENLLSGMGLILCWLPDYGVVRAVNSVYTLSPDLKSLPHLAKQASLSNVVNLTNELCLGPNGYELQLKKSINNVEGVCKVAFDCIDHADKILFSIIHEDENILYGDLICVKKNTENSVTNVLIEQNLLAKDEEMFTSITNRNEFKKCFFQNANSWKQNLNQIEKENLSKIIFNDKESNSDCEVDFFKTEEA